MITVYAEKFDVGVKIAAALAGFDYNGTKVTMSNVESLKPKLKKDVKRKGVIYIDYKGEKYAITWGQGHMCTLKQARDYDPEYKNWSKIPLPYFPNKYEIKVKDGVDFNTHKSTGEPDKWTVAQLNIIEKLFNSSSYIINATDDDREGELIFAYVYEYLNCRTPYKRVRLDSQTEKGFRDAFEKLVDSSVVKPVENAGRCRGIADWMSGINLSSKMTLKYGKYLPDIPMITIGRIQTVVLDFIVEREKAIKSFKSKPFWTINAEFENSAKEKYKAKHEQGQIENKKDAEDILNKITGQKGEIIEAETTPISKEVPLLYSLLDLSRDANKQFGYTAEQTLNITQSLYEAGYVTYPRTESQCLTDDMEPVVDETLEMLKTYDPQYKKWIESAPTRNYTKRHFNTKKVESHYAIIPTTEIPKGLSSSQKDIYDLIAKSLIRIIFKPAKGEKTSIVTEVNGEKFKSTGTVIVDPQWLIVDGKIDSELLPKVNIGDLVSGKYELKEGKTEPPKRYTDASLLVAMKTASKGVDDEELKKILVTKNKGGIGRPSTQGPIIENVVSKYCKRSGKSIIPTESAMKIIDILPVDELKSPDLTAEWEMKLDEIEKGKTTSDDFLRDMEAAVRRWCKTIDEDKTELEVPASTFSTEYICPKCGAPMNKYKWGWACSAYSKDREDSCSFAIGYNMAGATFADKDIIELLTNRRTKKMFEFVKKNSSERYKAFVIIDENGNLNRTWNTPYSCPLCGKPITVNSRSWSCSGWKEGCGFVLWDTVFGKKLSDRDKELLITKKKTNLIKGFIRKDGTKYDATLALDENGKVGFYNDPSKKQEVDMFLRCPKCGKPILKGPKAWSCSGWKEGCEFVIWNTIMGKTLTEKNKEDLIKKGETSEIKGFIKKDGGTFSAKLKLDENDKVVPFWDKR